MTYASVEKAESGVEIQGDERRNRSTSRVETAPPSLRDREMKEHFANVDTTHRFIETLYRFCLERYAAAPAERGAGQ